MTVNQQGKMTFGERLKKLRNEKGFSQMELANKVDIHYNNISRYERSDSKPTAKALKALADALNVSTDYLYDGNEEDATFADLEDKELLELFKKVEHLEQKEKEMIKVFLNALVKNKEAVSILAS